MSDKSPLFVSALELIAHSTELFAQKNPKKFKFIILHLANAIELILKDCVIDQGISIYEEKSGRTINIWECFKKLEGNGIHVPEKPVIELLIDDRNNIQHRFGSPTPEAVYYYIDEVVDFFQGFLERNYNIQFVEAIESHLSSPDHLSLLGLTKNEHGNLSQIMRYSHEAAIVQAYKELEKKIFRFLAPYLSQVRGRIDSLYWRSPIFSEFFLDLEKKGYFSQKALERFEQLRITRNKAAHVDVVAEPDLDWQAMFETATELLDGLKKAEDAGYEFSPSST